MRRRSGKILRGTRGVFDSEYTEFILQGYGYGMEFPGKKEKVSDAQIPNTCDTALGNSANDNTVAVVNGAVVVDGELCTVSVIQAEDPVIGKEVNGFAEVNDKENVDGNNKLGTCSGAAGLAIPIEPAHGKSEVPRTTRKHKGKSGRRPEISGPNPFEEVSNFDKDEFDLESYKMATELPFAPRPTWINPSCIGKPKPKRRGFYWKDGHRHSHSHHGTAAKANKLCGPLQAEMELIPTKSINKNLSAFAVPGVIDSKNSVQTGKLEEEIPKTIAQEKTTVLDCNDGEDEVVVSPEVPQLPVTFTPSTENGVDDDLGLDGKPSSVGSEPAEHGNRLPPVVVICAHGGHRYDFSEYPNCPACAANQIVSSHRGGKSRRNRGRGKRSSAK